MAFTLIDEYEVFYFSNQNIPRIWLKKGDKYIARLSFYPDGAELPKDGIFGFTPNLNYHLQNYEHCIDLLRNEKPIYLIYNGPGQENGIKTIAEAIGEAE